MLQRPAKCYVVLDRISIPSQQLLSKWEKANKWRTENNDKNMWIPTYSIIIKYKTIHVFVSITHLLSLTRYFYYALVDSLIRKNLLHITFTESHRDTTPAAPHNANIHISQNIFSGRYGDMPWRISCILYWYTWTLDVQFYLPLVRRTVATDYILVLTVDWYRLISVDIDEMGDDVMNSCLNESRI